MTYGPLELRRDNTPVLVCGCSHVDAEHDDGCLRGGCGCKVLRPVERRWRVHGWLCEPINSQTG